MKLTVEIPDSLYRRAKIRAVEEGGTLRELVIASLERELAGTGRVAEEAAPYFARRTLLPAFRKLRAVGAFTGGTDSTAAVSEERDAR
ncbi:MAG: hypothetical protein HKN82_13050 [Akkermansiaceae bacterium]|nr:hypothetical protein [Akkermansiaceae bacterium]NNM29007.1 hypothetical protein [Akkermansiaceae bacterium]